MCRSSVAAFYALSKRLFYSITGPVHGDRFLTFPLPLGIRSEVEKIVHWMPEILFASEIALRSLHRSMAEQELNLLQLTVAIMAQLRARPAAIPHAA
jgi:hypothetical protein